MSGDKKDAKNKRRNAKAAVTRLGKTLVQLIEGSRSVNEVRESLLKVQEADLILKHEEYTQHIDDDDEFETEEEWMEECRQNTLRLELGAKDYLRAVDNQHETSTTTASEGAESSVGELSPGVLNGVNVTGQADTGQAEVSGQANESSAADQANGNNAACGFRMEKPKMPKFSGDVREYITFRSDFKHVVESRYNKRDSIMLLRTSLQGKPLDLIRDWIRL